MKSFNRRSFLGTGAAGLGGAALAAAPARAQEAAKPAATIDATAAGLVPDSIEDQSAVLQAAIDLAIDRSAMLALPGGRIVAGGISIAGGLHMTGVRGHTVIQPLDTAKPVFSIVRSAYVTLQGITVDAGKNSARTASDVSLIEALGDGDIVLDGCQVLNAPGTGLTLKGCTGRITGCTIAYAGNAAIFALDSKGLEISQNRIHDCGNNGVLVWQSTKREDGTIVTGNRIERIGANDGGSGQNGNGVNIYRAGHVIVSNNRIADCAFSAIRSNAGSYCQFVGNNCARLGEVALYAEFGFEGAVIADNVVETAAAGISITNFNEGGRLAVCSGNLLRNLVRRKGDKEERGIGIAVEADTAVTGNVVEGAETIGIALGWDKYLRDVTAGDNIVRDCPIGIGISMSEGAGKVLVANNVVSGAKQAAIAGLEQDKVTMKDLDAPGQFTRKNATLSGNLVV